MQNKNTLKMHIVVWFASTECQAGNKVEKLIMNTCRASKIKALSLFMPTKDF
jgi:hypothetical protein